MSHGLQFQASYVLTRDLSNAGGGGSDSVRGRRGGNFVTDRFHPGLDYGNVIFDRRHRVLSTFLYELPFGKGATFLANSGRLLDAAVGGWQLGGVLVFQSGAFLTAAQEVGGPGKHEYPERSRGDPGGRGFRCFASCDGGADELGGPGVCEPECVRFAGG